MNRAKSLTLPFPCDLLVPSKVQSCPFPISRYTADHLLNRAVELPSEVKLCQLSVSLFAPYLTNTILRNASSCSFSFFCLGFLSLLLCQAMPTRSPRPSWMRRELRPRALAFRPQSRN